MKKTKAAVSKAKQQVKAAVQQTKQVVKKQVLPAMKKAAQATTKAVKNAVKPKNLLNTLQTGLDIVGMVPVVGEVADGVNGIIYAARGDKVNAALSFGAMIPVVGNAATAGKWVNKGAKAAKGISENAQKANKGLLGNVKEKVNKQVSNVKTQIQVKVDEVKQQLRQLRPPEMELAGAGVNVRRIEDTGTVGKNTSSSSPKPSNSQPPQNGSNKKPDENKGTKNNTARALNSEEAIAVARKKLEQERAELINGKYIDPNTNEIYIPHVITAAVDMKAGKTYIGYNGVGTDLRTGNPRFNPTASDLLDDTKKLVEKTKQRAMEKEGKNSFERWEVENCAEIQAVNQAFKEGAKLEDILLSTISSKDGKYKEMCRNCSVTFEEFIVDIPFGKK
ncbi:hypothetical protein HXV90_00825 [Lysinibacillus sp. JK80]|uniref:hypothetical protein n=1 Tax=Lysinibacillus sp. JK80 TaxID=2749809 RepID=UPI0022B9951A|nr:hypothetical protein [Lysinibacillus sp. JK80]WBF54508.1 hypothetical protein HXV90_00825 [Lysinibacillus sp. JK80]